MTENIDDTSFIKYKTTTMTCQCPDRKNRKGGSLVLKGQRVCKHIKALRERCWKNNAEKSIQTLFPTPLRQHREYIESQGEEWEVISQAEAMQKFPVGLSTKHHTDFLKLQTYCQRFLKDLEITEAYGAPQDRAAIPAFIIRAAQNMSQVLKELA